MIKTPSDVLIKCRIDASKKLTLATPSPSSKYNIWVDTKIGKIVVERKNKD